MLFRSPDTQGPQRWGGIFTEPYVTMLVGHDHAKLGGACPGFQGDRATGGTKPATLETGAVVQVPLFVQQGEIVRVDTRTSQYLERAG